MFEIQDPHFLIRHEYSMDSAGAGRWRGGLGVETEFEIYGENVTGISFGDGVEEEAKAFGLFGGKQGSVNSVTLRYPDGTERKAKSKEIIRNIPVGTVFHDMAGGGGGYGDPLLRPVERVLKDVKNEVISIESAETNYGVVIDSQTLKVDPTSTKRLRGGKK
jgi:N-methylhydantoinase B